MKDARLRVTCWASFNLSPCDELGLAVILTRMLIKAKKTTTSRIFLICYPVLENAIPKLMMPVGNGSVGDIIAIIGVVREFASAAQP
jgi:hypothetical protein